MSASASASSAAAYHAIKLLHRIGKKYTYVVQASALAEMQILFPGFQRELASEHVDSIVAHQRHLMSTIGYYMYVGAIILCEYKDRTFCIDGQHRYHSIQELMKPPVNGFAFSPDFDVLIEVIHCATEDEMIQWFRVVNSNRPVPAFLMNAVSSSSMQAFMQDPSTVIREYMKETYPKYLKTTPTPQCPHVNLEKFVGLLDERYHLSYMENPVEWLEQENKEQEALLRAKAAKGDLHAVKALDNVTKKATKGKLFFLGAYWNKKAPTNVPAAMRSQVWNTWYGSLPVEKKGPNNKALCPCCNHNWIEPGTMHHTGHRISAKNGGPVHPSNLIPLCIPCNLAMQERNYDDYKAEFYPDEMDAYSTHSSASSASTASTSSSTASSST